MEGIIWPDWPRDFRPSTWTQGVDAARGAVELQGMADRPDAPRLRAYFQHAEGKAVLTMPREEWDRFQVTRGATALVDVTRTPMARVASEATVVVAVARQFSDTTAEVTIYRDDPADTPKRINADPYVAWLDLPSHQSFSQMLTAASTRDNRNLRDFLRQNVLLVKQPPDAGHRDVDLPASVHMALKRASNSAGSR